MMLEFRFLGRHERGYDAVGLFLNITTCWSALILLLRSNRPASSWDGKIPLSHEIPPAGGGALESGGRGTSPMSLAGWGLPMKMDAVQKLRPETGGTDPRVLEDSDRLAPFGREVEPPLAADGVESAWPVLDCANPRAVVTLTRMGVGSWPKKRPEWELYPGMGPLGWWLPYWNQVPEG
jgi:hypothetical protein